MEMESLFLGQVGSESLTCTFRANYCSVCLFSVRDREKKGRGIEGRGAACTGRCKGAPAVRPGSVTGGGFWFQISYIFIAELVLYL